MRPTTLLFAAIAVAMAGPGWTAQPSAVTTTTKSVDQFGRCFVATQGALQAWWFVPSADGGTFSNFGAPGVRQVYYLKLEQSGPEQTEIRLEGPQSRTVQSIRTAIERCA